MQNQLAGKARIAGWFIQTKSVSCNTKSQHLAGKGTVSWFIQTKPVNTNAEP